MRAPWLPLMLLVGAMLCHAQTPATTNAPRHTFAGFDRVPDGRLRYLFTTQDPGVTNHVFMGGSIGGRQLLGYSSQSATLTLSASGGGELLLATGASFTEKQHAPREHTTEAVAKVPALPQETASVALPVVSARAAYIDLGRGSATTRATTTTTTLATPALGNAVRQNDFFFGTEYMYPTRFEVKTFPYASPDGRVQYYYPVVIPRDFRSSTWGVRGGTR